MRKIILNLHLFAALVGGLFLIVAGVTGSILAFQDELDPLLNPGLFKITPAEQTLPLTDIQDLLKKEYPDKNFGRFILPRAGNEPYIAQSRGLQVFVNGHTGAIVGSRTTPTLLDNIHTLHTSLWLGSTGRMIVTAATFLSIFLIITGLYLWWPVRNTGMARGWSFYLHYALGLYFSLFLIILSVSGLVIYFDEPVSAWVFKATNSPPIRWSVPSTFIPGVQAISASNALEIADKRFTGSQPFSINIPSTKEGSYTVAVRFPGNPRNCLAIIDQYTGTILSVVDSRVPTSGQRIMFDNGEMHTGVIFGMPSKVVMSVSSLILAIQTITGYCLWWRKLRRKPQPPV